MQQRGEWNWPISSNTLEMEWLQQKDVQQQLPSNLQLAELHNIFSTDFERQTWLYEHEKTIIEVAIDHGKVIAGQYSQDRKSTRLNSSHVRISYAVFCLKKKKKKKKKK